MLTGKSILSRVFLQSWQRFCFKNSKRGREKKNVLRSTYLTKERRERNNGAALRLFLCFSELRHYAWPVNANKILASNYKRKVINQMLGEERKTHHGTREKLS